MTQWFQERYISRGEHQQVVDFYRKLVVQLHRKLKEMRAAHDLDTVETAIAQVRAPNPPAGVAATPRNYGDNVIRLDLRRRARPSAPRPSTH
jgi:hypothetical protein